MASSVKTIISGDDGDSIEVWDEDEFVWVRAEQSVLLDDNGVTELIRALQESRGRSKALRGASE